MTETHRISRARRVAAVLATALAVGALAGCGDPSPRPAPPAPVVPPPPSVAPNDEGITTPAQEFGSACTQPADRSAAATNQPAAQPVAAAIAQNPQLKIFSEAITKAGIADRLNRLIGATVFAPDDEAFGKYRDSIGPDRWAALLADPKGLTDLLTYHVIDRRYSRDGLLAATDGVATLYGGVLRVAPVGDTITVTDLTKKPATVTCGNIPTANATVFVIDRVLIADLKG
jgi:uncharacterized surface protein with fasciclin (FAS1) repeats